MLGQLRRVIGRSYIRERALNLNRLNRARKERCRSQPNSVFAQFSVVYMFNWMLGQLRKTVGRSYIRGKASNLNRLSSAKEYETSLLTQFNVRAILSRVYVQLDARPIEEGCEKIVSWRKVVSWRRVVYSWKSSESESAEQRERKKIKSRSQPNSVFAQFSVVYMFNWMLGRLRKAVGRSYLKKRSYVRGKALNLSRLSSAMKRK